MPNLPNDIVIAAWVNLARAHSRLLGQMESDLKQASLPPLSWYDVLWELRRVPGQTLRPHEFEQHLLLPQHSVSRLLDRLENHGLVQRLPDEQDGRAQKIKITPLGVATQKKMWRVYGPSIQRLVGDALTADEAQQLAGILTRIAPRTGSISQ